MPTLYHNYAIRLADTRQIQIHTDRLSNVKMLHDYVQHVALIQQKKLMIDLIVTVSTEFMPRHPGIPLFRSINGGMCDSQEH